MPSVLKDTLGIGQLPFSHLDLNESRMNKDKHDSTTLREMYQMYQKNGTLICVQYTDIQKVAN